MNEAIERINRRLINLHDKKEKAIDALSDWVNENVSLKASEDRHGRNLTRNIYQIGAKITILEELKAELEEADTLAELDEMIASETN